MENANTTKKDKFNVKDLNLYYGNFQALKHISMDIREKGEWMAIAARK